MSSMLNIFFFATYQDGTGYYRIHNPAQMIKKLGLAKVYANPFQVTMLNQKVPKENDAWYDFEAGKDGIVKNTRLFSKMFENKIDAVVFQRMDSPQMFALAIALKEQFNIPIIQETDDYVWDVPPLNPGLLSYYEKKQDMFTDPSDPVTLARRSLGVFDGYIVTTPFLQNFYKNFSPTFICPNSLDVSKRRPKPYKHHKDIRVMWSTSAGHMDNMRIIKEPIKRIMEKYPNVTFYQYNYLPNLLEGTPYEKRVVKMKWVHPDKYWEYINSLSPDVCLSPIHDSMYNRAKSNLRILEYWTAGNNLVIASPVGHYKETIIEGKNGLFAKNDWYEKIEYAMKHPELREKLGKEGRKTVEKDFNLEKNARLWIDAVKSVISSYKPYKQAPDKYVAPENREGS